MLGTADFSDDGLNRYVLTRQWQDGDRGHVLFVMLNPSIADAVVNDRTVDRCIGFARSWGYDGLTVGNLFALVSKDPNDLNAAIVDPLNDETLEALAHRDGIGLVLAAWGTRGGAAA